MSGMKAKEEAHRKEQVIVETVSTNNILLDN
jgi:hypothetical protein